MYTQSNIQHCLKNIGLYFCLCCLLNFNIALAVTQEFNSTGGTNSTDGLHVYINENTQMQIKHFNNSGQLYNPSAVPSDISIDNGIFLRADGSIYGPSHNVTTYGAWAPSGGMYSTYSISNVSPANPPSYGVQQTATSSFGITSGPQVNVTWSYTNPFDFITAQVTVTIPATYPISSTNPVRYYHVVDNYLGGSDNGCGVKYTDANGNLVVGSYPPTSGTTCPSSTSVPAGVSVTESFRSRGTPSFSNYCVVYWNDIYSASLGCSINNSNDLTNTITTSYQDTGSVIEYAFTAPGVYTFSYDFIVGTSQVPSYDHLEISHPGSTSLCPATVTVLACTSSTVPCPNANIVHTGTLTGNIGYSPSTPTISQSPSTFTLGSTANTASVILQGSGAGIYTLSATNLSSLPLNGTKCWNTATGTASCLFTVQNIACASNFECLESGLPYNNLTSSPGSRNPLYTKISGTGFTFDVVALQSGGQQATSYTANSGVTVELFDDSASPQPACSAYSSPIASQAITFSSTDLGRKTIPASFSLSKAYRKVRCRVVDNNIAVKGCSSDDFAVRPSAFTLTSSNANADTAGSSISATPIIKTGTNFSLSATTNVVGYDGTPAIDSTKVGAHTGAIQAGSVGGNFSAASASTGNASGSTFTYSEVGYFNLNTNGVYDSTFTAIDSANGDCNAGFNASGSKNACSFGNTSASNYFGRFIPDHFAITPGTTTVACSSGAFSYFGQDGFSTAFTLNAQNSANTTTKNYTGSFAKLGLSTWANYNFSAAILPSGAVLSASATTPSGTWSNGSASISAKHQISRPTAATAPTSITVSASPIDSDGVTMSSTAVATASNFKYGRLFMPNTYGSELLQLAVPIEAQYWNGTAYQRNQQDSCSVIPTVSIAMGNYKNNLAACETALSGAGTMSSGKVTATLSKPGSGNNGSVDLSVNINSAAGSTCTPTSTAATAAGVPWFGANASSRATFGLFKSPVIYTRENF